MSTLVGVRGTDSVIQGGGDQAGMVVEVDGRQPQAAVDAASPGETVRFDSSVRHTLADPLVVTTPGLVLRGLALRWPTVPTGTRSKLAPTTSKSRNSLSTGTA